MSGVRLHHPIFASCTLVVELPQVYPRAYVCPSCGKTHERKAVHLRLDARGDVIVAHPVYEALRTVFLAGMEVTNEIAEPPPLILGAIEQPKYETIEHNLNGQDQRFYLPGRTKYASRDRVRKALAAALNGKGT